MIDFLKSISVILDDNSLAELMNHPNPFVSMSYRSSTSFDELISKINVFPRLIVSNNGVKMASFGSLIELTAKGDSRFEQAETQFYEYLKKIAQLGDEKPFFLGGASFDDSVDDKLWELFKPLRFIMGYLQIIETEHTSVIVNLPTNPSELRIVTDQLQKNPRIVTTSSSCSNRQENPSRPEWVEQVVRNIRQIKEGTLDKVVMARDIEYVVHGYLEMIIYSKLSEKYPNCFTFHFEMEKGIFFTGASPELLFSLNHNRFNTMALAGTLDGSNHLSADELLKDEKLREEHQIVVNSIENHLEDLGVKHVKIHKTSLRRLRSLIHLQTEIEGRFEGTIFPIIQNLHPTPAVGGYPSDTAMQLIKLERERGWYAGPIGVISEFKSEIYVGLRSALINGDVLRIYAGAGVVGGSDPEEEWEEIDLKLKSIEEILPR